MTPTRTPPETLAERLSRWSGSQLEQSRPAPSSAAPGRAGTILRRLVPPLVTVVVIVAVLSVVVGGAGDAIWFSSVGFGSVWTTETGYGVGLLAGGVLVAAIVLAGNLLLAWRIAREPAVASWRGPGTPGGNAAREGDIRGGDVRGGAATGAPGSEVAGTRAADDDLSSGEIMAGRSAIEPSGSRATDALGRPVRRGLAGRVLHGGLFVVGLPVIGLVVVGWQVARFLAGSRLTRSTSLARPGAALQGAPATADPGLRAVSSTILRSVFVAIGLLLAAVIGLQLQAAWQTVALWLHQVPWSSSGPALTDPVFGLDLAWWLFSLPLLHLAANTIALLLALTLLVTGAAYGIAAIRGADLSARGPILHLGILGAALLLAIAATQWLGRYDIAYTQTGIVTGVSATDAAVRLPFGALFAATSALLAVAFLALALTRNQRVARLASIGGAAWYAALAVASVAVPFAYQQLVVTPSQNVAEAPYIANNIAQTRLGYALDDWQLQPYAGKPALAPGDVANDQATFSNARLWDSTTLASTLDQLQTVRQYYDFTSVDIDRYVVNDAPTEVMLSAREMALTKSQSNPGWVARHILYTHGYGLAMVPVNGVDKNGLPELLVKDLPTSSASGAPVVTQPRIYFGRRPSDWVLVDARSAEFDYPANSGSAVDVTTRYGGDAGIGLGSPIARLFWAVRLADANLLLSDQVTAETKLLIHRSLGDRLGLLAPFLSLDPDPYLVVTPDGHLVYVQDAYTTSAALPHATAVNDPNLGATYDYIRNSVKITVDAYDGTTHFYVTDPSDPIIRAWEGVFPGMFEPMSAIPAGLAAHLRTPSAMFNTQVQIFARYHVTDVASFYKSDDVWTAASIKLTKSARKIGSYYVEVRLPGQPSPEFVLIEPMVPASRPNMIAWVAARNDGAARGQVIVYQLPASTTIQGPTQIEARIDQDPVISAQLSLWNQSGSKVIRGSLLTIPVGSSFLYVEPIYLQSTRSAFPQLAKVVVASSATVAWGNTLDEALGDVTSGVGTAGSGTAGSGTAGSGTAAGGSPGASPSPQPSGGPGVSPLPTDVPGLIQYANEAFAAAKAAQADGDFVTYGAEMQRLEAALQALDARRAGGAALSPSPGQSTPPLATQAP